MTPRQPSTAASPATSAPGTEPPLKREREGLPCGDPSPAGTGLIQTSSLTSCSMRARMSSRIGRTASMPWPAGSSSFQSS